MEDLVWQRMEARLATMLAAGGEEVLARRPMLLTDRPRFKDDLDVEIVEPDLVFVRSEHDSTPLRSRLLYLLAPRLTGRVTVKELCEHLEGTLSPLDIEHGLSLLDEGRFLTGEPAPCRTTLSGMVSRQSRIAIRVDGCEPAAGALARAFETIGVPPGDTGLVITCVQDLLDDPPVEDRPWLPVKLAGTLFSFGPLFENAKAPCHGCFAERVRNARRFELPGSEGRRTAPFLVPTDQDLLDSMARQIVHVLTPPRDPRLLSCLVTLNALTGRIRSHAVVARPHCDTCGRKTTTPTRTTEIVLSRSTTVARDDGGYRTSPADGTFERLVHHVDPLTGAVPRLASRWISPDGGIHVWLAGHDIARDRRSFRGHCAGKGATPEQARLGALCESLERQAGVWRGDEVTRVASFAELGDEAVHPNACMLFSDAQYRQREVWNRVESAHNWVPEPFDEKQPIPWSPVWSLTRKITRFLPAGYCYYKYPGLDGEPWYRADSNGCAAGNNLEEAILQGFLELVERDGVALWWYQRFRRPAFDLDSFDSACIRRFVESFRLLGRAVHVLDVTSDLGIPVAAAVSAPVGSSGRSVIVGFGSHLDPAVAVIRALTEMSQFLPVITLAGPPQGDFVFDDSRADLSYLAPEPGSPALSVDDIPNLATDDLAENVRRCVSLAEERGLETLVLDQTRVEIGLRVVRVLVPGLRPFWARFAPGRLFTVPLRLGWSSVPLGEEDLNPIPIRL